MELGDGTDAPRSPIAPPPHALRAIEAEGAAGRAWLEALPEAVARVERAWGLVVERAAGRSTESVVLLARRGERPVAVKMVLPWVDPERRELRILRSAAGRGYAALIDAEEASNILLLERLGGMLADAPIGETARHAAICAALRIAWAAPPPAGLPLPSGAEKARSLASEIVGLWEATGRPCPERTIEAAARAAGRRAAAHDPGRAVLAHGDPHAWNTLSAPESPSGWKFVDPDGALAEPAFDLAVLLREWPAAVLRLDMAALAGARCAELCALAGLAPAPLWDWAILHSLQSGLRHARVGSRLAADIQIRMPAAWVESVRSLQA